jgi:hypothetical protein
VRIGNEAFGVCADANKEPRRPWVEVCMCVVCVCVSVCVGVCVCVCERERESVCVYPHTHAHTNSYTYTGVRVDPARHHVGNCQVRRIGAWGEEEVICE